MKRFLLMALVTSCFNLTNAQIFAPEGINMPGSYNGFQNPPSVLALAGPQVDGGKVTLNSTLPTRIYKTTIKVAASGGDITAGAYAFLFTSGPSGNQFANKWAGATVSANSVSSYSYNTGADNSVTVVNDKYYTVVFRDNGYASTQAGWFVTNDVPVKVSSVSKDLAAVYPLQNVVVTAQLDASLPVDQFVYLRYSTTTNYSESVLLKMSVSGTTATGTISAAYNIPSRTVYYYVFTSSIDNMTGLTADLNLKLLEVNNNNTTGGYTYTVNSGYVSSADGAWSDAGSWNAGVVPPDGTPVTIAGGTSVSLTNQTVNVSSLTIAGALTNNNSTTEILEEGTLTATSGTYTDNGGTVYCYGNATFTGNITFNNLITAGGINVATGAVVNGTLEIESGGFLTGQTITYGTSSTLKYNTEGSYDISNEWVAGTSQPGVPYNVEVTGFTSVNFASAGSRSILENLIVTSGSSLSLSATEGAILKIKGNVDITGTLTANNTRIELNGTSLQTFKGITTLPFLTVNNSGSGIQLENNVTVTSTSNGLKMVAGNINTNSFVLSLNTAGYADMEYTAGTIIGKFKRGIPVAALAKGGEGNSPQVDITMLYPVGTSEKYRPLTIVITSLPLQSNPITVEYQDGEDGVNLASTIQDGDYILNRRSGARWKCDGSTLNGGLFNLRLGINGVGGIGDISKLTIIRSVNGTDFSVTGTSVASVSGEARRDGLDFAVVSDPNYFYLGSNTVDNELPVELTSFKANTRQSRVNLLWETSNEVQSSEFKIERKPAGAAWETISTVAAAGYSNSVKKYTYTDNLSKAGSYIYRLKMIDNDGTFTYSKEIEVQLEMPQGFTVSQNYPNPFNPETRIDYSVAERARVVFELYGIAGEKIATLLDEAAEAGFYVYQFNPAASGLQLTSGLYLMKVTMFTGNSNRTFSSVKKLTLLK